MYGKINEFEGFSASTFGSNESIALKTRMLLLFRISFISGSILLRETICLSSNISDQKTMNCQSSRVKFVFIFRYGVILGE